MGAVQNFFFENFEQVVTKPTPIEQIRQDFGPKNSERTQKNANFWPSVQNWGTILNARGAV